MGAYTNKNGLFPEWELGVRVSVPLYFWRRQRAGVTEAPLTIRTNCPGILRWSTDGWQTVREAPLSTADGGAMAGFHSYSLTLDRIPEEARAVEFTFTCTECGCRGEGICCGGTPQRILIGADGDQPARAPRTRRTAVPKQRR